MTDRARLGALAGCAAASVALYVGLAFVLMSVPPGYQGFAGSSLPSVELYRRIWAFERLDLAPRSWGVAMVAILAGLWGLWCAGAVCLRGLGDEKTRARGARLSFLWAAVAVAVCVLLVAPSLSADLYYHAIFGRMVAFHGLNPYATPAGSVAGDPLTYFVQHVDSPTTYGAAYTWLSAIAARLGGRGLVGTVLAWKTMGALTALACAVLAARVARRLGARDRGDLMLLVGANPLVLVESAGSAHNEAVMMALALAGLSLALADRPVRGLLLVAASVLVKWVTGVLFVLLLAYLVRSAPPERRGRALARLLGPALLLALLLYSPFLLGLGSAGGALGLLLRGREYLGAPPSGLPSWPMQVAFAVALAVLIPWASRGGIARAVAVSSALMLGYVMLVFPWSYPWYFVPAMLLALVLPGGRPASALRLVAVSLGAGMMVHYARLVPI